MKKHKVKSIRYFCTFLVMLLLFLINAFLLTGCKTEEKLYQQGATPDLTGEGSSISKLQAQNEYMQPILPNTTVELTSDVEKTQPKPKPKPVGKPVEIASYTTKLLNRSKNRVNNIDIASEKLDKKQIAPGEEFSFNETIGRRTEAKGYEEAPIIINTEDGPKNELGVGGGVCQLSTTLFNAVEEAGLKVTERHMHSKDVKYVPEGEDATVAYGSVDFKFINTRENPITIRVYLSKKNLTVKIFENRA